MTPQTPEYGVAAARPPQRGLVCVGMILGARGLHGDVWVRSFTADPDSIGRYGPLTDAAGERTFRLTFVGHGRDRQRLVARVTGVNDRNAAEAMKGIELFVPRAALPPPAADEFYHADLIGLRADLAAMGPEGEPALGEVRDVQNFGGGAILEIALRSGGVVLVPFTRAAVPVVDLRVGRVVIEPLPGLLEPAEDSLSGGLVADHWPA